MAAPSRGPRGSALGPGGGIEVLIASNIRQILLDLKELDPKLARETRRKLRQSGDETISEMRAELSKPSPGVVTQRIVRRSRRADGTGQMRYRLQGVVTTGARGSGRRGSRAAIAAGLKTRVVMGQSRQSIRITGAGDPFARSYNMTSWRHPVFLVGRERGARAGIDAGELRKGAAWVEQGGVPYFGDVILRNRKNIQERVEEAMTAAIEAMAAGKAGPMEVL